MSRPSDDDLLLPALTEADDAVGFDRPWNPWSLVMLTFFFGVIAGGGLLALNFPRLGIRGRLYPTLALVAVAALAITAGFSWAISSGLLNPQDREDRTLARWVARGISCLVTIAIALPQQKRFRLFQASNLPGGRLLCPALAAIAVALPMEVLLRLAFAALFRS